MPAPLERLAPALAGRYRIERELGHGGMATVFLAEDLKHRRSVAIKVLDPDLAAAIGPERFVREIETAARLTHPHILPLFDSGVADGLLYYVMPYVAGESLRSKLAREKQLPVAEALRLAGEVADALDHAHRHGVVHRDIKPENILLEEGHALVADFGIARVTAPATASDTQAVTLAAAAQTTLGITLGTPTYMSPEQVMGSHDLDGRSDLYSLGCVLYEMLAGVPPFAGPTAQAVMHQHVTAVPAPVTASRPEVPGAVAVVLARTLAKTPEERPGSGRELAQAVAEAAHAPASAATRTATVPLPVDGARAGERPTRAWRGRWLAAAVAVLAVAGLGAVAWWQSWGPFAGSPAPVARKDWILVAEFEGPPGDSTLAPAVKSLLSAALDQSRIVATVPPEQVRQALEAAGKPRNARVDAELAHELAYRSAVRAVLEGTVGRLGKGYSIVVRVVDADTARVILTESAAAKDDDDLIRAMGEMARQLRQGLGENRRSLRATRAMNLAATPSFEAYKLYVEGQREFSFMRHARALSDYRQALALDPDFASVWAAMSRIFGNLGRADSALFCFEQAMRRPERLLPGQRRALETQRRMWEGDYLGVVAEQEAVLQDDPGDYGALSSSGFTQVMHLGRFEQGLARVRQAIEMSPFGPSDWLLTAETVALRGLGRFDEARASGDRIRGIARIGQRALTEISAARFAAAESIVVAVRDDPRTREDFPEGDEFLLRFPYQGRGAVAAAMEVVRRGIEVSARSGDIYGALWDWRAGLETAVVTGVQVPPHDPALNDSTAAAWFTLGLEAVVVGDQATARRCLEVGRARPYHEVTIGDVSKVPTMIEARLAALEGRPAEAVRLLRPIDHPAEFWGVSFTWVHWWLTDAYEQLGQADSAAFYLERALASSNQPDDVSESPYVHHRLALLYARLGRAADAERHLAAAERAWDKPDPAIRRKLEEARAVVRGARGMAAPPG